MERTSRSIPQRRSVGVRLRERPCRFPYEARRAKRPRLIGRRPANQVVPAFRLGHSLQSQREDESSIRWRYGWRHLWDTRLGTPDRRQKTVHRTFRKTASWVDRPENLSRRQG